MSRQEKWLAEGQVTSETAMVHGELDGRAPAPPALIDEELADQLRFRASEGSSRGRYGGRPGRRAARHTSPPGHADGALEVTKTRAGGQLRSGPFRRAAVRGPTRRDRQQRSQPEAQSAAQRRIAS